MSLEQRFLTVDALPKEFRKPFVQNKTQDTCVFCNGSQDDYYSDIVREWYDVSEKTKFARGLNPEKCPHDTWLTKNSAYLITWSAAGTKRSPTSTKAGLNS